MDKRTYTKTELGMIYGIAIGATVILIMYALTDEILWNLTMGLGLALGLGIGASLDKKRG